MCQPIRGHGVHLDFPIGLKNTNLIEDMSSCFLSRFIKFCSVVTEKSKMYQQIRDHGGHLGFPIGPKNTIGRGL